MNENTTIPPLIHEDTTLPGTTHPPISTHKHQHGYQASSGAFDLVVSADVLVYYGRIEYILGTLSRALKPQKGLLAFTLEALKDGDAQVLRQRAEKQGQGQEGEEEWILRDTGALPSLRVCTGHTTLE